MTRWKNLSGIIVSKRKDYWLVSEERWWWFINKDLKAFWVKIDFLDTFIFVGYFLWMCPGDHQQFYGEIPYQDLSL